MRPNTPADATRVHVTPPQLFNYRAAQWPDLRADIMRALQRGSFAPRLNFHDPELWRIAAKLKDSALTGGAPLPHYGEALVVLLAHELLHRNGTPPGERTVRGGLSGWRRKQVTDYIEEHLGEEVRLSTLAALVDLSPYHFVRAFRQSFGMPPHRYHIGRRIEHAKTLLDEPANSVTDIARSLGFAETSSFSAAFRRITGCSPSQYRRRLC